MPGTLIVTGPMNASQLGVPKDADYRVIHIHPKGSDIGSNAMQAAASAWLGGKSLRDRVGGTEPIGVAWFSAGHGAVRAILSTSSPSDAAAWLCIDGLYGGNDFATRLASAASSSETSLLATASTSTPGQYDHSLDRWRDAVAKAEIPEANPESATKWGLPPPDQCWGKAQCLIAGYLDLGHHYQVPATRAAMLQWWDAARAPAPKPPIEPEKPPVQPVQPGIEPIDIALPIIGTAAIAGLVAYLLRKR